MSRAHRRNLPSHLVRFGRRLREHGVEVSIADQIDAAEALRLVDLGDRREVELALRTALKVRRSDWETFRSLFRRHWSAAVDADDDGGGDAGELDRPVDGGDDGRARRNETPDRDPGRPDGDPPHGGHRRAASGPAGPRKGPTPGAADAPGGGEPGYSPEITLRKKPFESCTEEELRRVERILTRLATRLAVRRSRRRVPGSRGAVDLRRSLRSTVRTAGEVLMLSRRQRARDEPELVLLCDTSGSMDPHSRFLLAFAMSLRRVARQSEVFAFDTELHRLTPWVRSGRARATLRRFATEITDWSGGTRIGECLASFVDRHLDTLVSARTTVVILSDGLDRGDVEELEAAMARIQRRARRVVWLNPLLGDPRYRPAARGMQAALPYVDHFAPGHNLESLERLLPLLGA